MGWDGTAPQGLDGRALPAEQQLWDHTCGRPHLSRGRHAEPERQEHLPRQHADPSQQAASSPKRGQLTGANAIRDPGRGSQRAHAPSPRGQPDPKKPETREPEAQDRPKDPHGQQSPQSPRPRRPGTRAPGPQAGGPVQTGNNTQTRAPRKRLHWAPSPHSEPKNIKTQSAERRRQRRRRGPWSAKRGR